MKNVLIMHTGGWIGDMVLLTPALRSLKEKFPDCRMAMLMLPLVSELMSRNPYIDEVIVYDKSKSQKGFQQMRRMADKLRSKDFDTAIILHPNSVKSAILAYMAGIPERIGLKLIGNGFFLTTKVKRRRNIHEVERYLNIISVVAGMGFDDKLEFWGIEQNDEDFVDKVFKSPLPPFSKGGIEAGDFSKGGVETDDFSKGGIEASDFSKGEVETDDFSKNSNFPLWKRGIKGDLKAGNFSLTHLKLKSHQFIVGFNVSTTWQTKMWRVERFARLAEMLNNQYGAIIILTGGKSDAQIGEKIMELAPDSDKYIIALTGNTTLWQLGNLIKHCDIYITCDSGPMHISAALNTPTIALFGPTDPIRHRPYGDGHIVIKKDMKCSPCYKRECKYKSFACMEAIQVEDVMEGLKSFFST
jgi:ADP-heptose:LPS heptosyltransferase